jgi:hypothetical protein
MMSLEEAVMFNRRECLTAAVAAGAVTGAGHKLAFDHGRPSRRKSLKTGYGRKACDADRRTHA